LTTPNIDQILEAVGPDLRARWRDCVGASDVGTSVDSKYQILLELLSSRARDQYNHLEDAVALHLIVWHEHTKQQGNQPLLQLLADETRLDHMRTSRGDLFWHSTAQTELAQTVMRELLLEKIVRTLSDRLLNTLLLLVAQES